MKKTKSKYDFLSVRIENDVTKELDARAEKRGLSRSKAIREAIGWYCAYSDGCVKFLRDMAESHNVPEATVAENMLLELIALQQGEDEVRGFAGPVEFLPRRRDGSVVTGLEFLKERTEVWKQRWAERLGKPLPEGGQVGDSRERATV